MEQDLQPAEPTVIWRPRSKPQEALIACPVFEVFFGGARGSLKTDSVIGDWINHSALYGEHAHGLMVRRTREELKHTFERAQQLYTPLGFKFSGHSCKSPNGSRLTFAYLDKDSDAERYQGWSLTRVYVEEVGNFPYAAPVLKLMATLRSVHGVPVGFRATGNPGGPGHHWVKARYITPARPWEIQQYGYENPWTRETVYRDRVFIPGKITDHDLLGAEYVAQLQMSGSETLVRAWLEGDWDAIIGAYFDCWRSEKHVIRPFPLGLHWVRFRAFDWGFASPFCVQWWAAVSEDTVHPDGFVIPKGALVCYREWYGADEQGQGLRMTDEQIAAGILARERDDPEVTDGSGKVNYAVADPSIWNARPAGLPGPSIAEAMARAGVGFRAADNNRIAGWQQMRSRMIGTNDLPMVFFFDSCTASIRTIPTLQHDETDPEDLDTEGEDHAADTARYACMSRPWTRPAPKQPEDMKGIEALTMDRLWKEHAKERRRKVRV